MSRNNVSSDKLTNIQHPTNSWVFLFKDDIEEIIASNNDRESKETPDIVKLRHPSTNEAAFFLFSPDNSLIQEILIFEEKRSWFIDDTVKSDGSMRVSTVVDPIFLVLPYLKKNCVDKAVPLDHLLQDQIYPETHRLIKCKGLEYLHLVADKKGTDDIVAFKYNEEKTLSWLKKKVTRLTDILKQKNICLEKNSSDELKYIRYAVGIISDYITEELSKKLAEHLHIPEETREPPILKRKSNAGVVEEETLKNVKKVKSNGEQTKKPTLKVTPKPKSKTQTKKLTTKGTQNIASFFRKSIE